MMLMVSGAPARGEPISVRATDEALGYREPVSRVHDMGGQVGFGPVPSIDEGPAAHSDWEAHVRALSTALSRRGVYSGDEFRDAIERIPPAEYLALSYYERWLHAMETLAAEKGLLAPGPGGAADSGGAAGGEAAGGEAAGGEAAGG
jgi:nitrile hydratase subunit beta